MKLIVLIVSVLGLALVGCQDQLRANLVKTCNLLGDTYAHYDAVASSGLISERTMARVAVVRQQTDALCTSPETATTISITATAARAYVALDAAFREGGNYHEAQVGYTKLQNLKGILEKARSR